MKKLLRLSSYLYGILTIAFVAAAVMLVVIAVHTGWQSVAQEGLTSNGALGVIEAVGLVTAAVAALQIAQTIGEEEVIRDAHIGAPTRARRYVSRFMVVIVTAMAIEGLVGTFKAMREDIALLPAVAAILVAVGFLLAGWGIFIRFNRYAEELEPESMRKAKEEDEKLE
jgi:hypothetical protein